MKTIASPISLLFTICAIVLLQSCGVSKVDFENLQAQKNDLEAEMIALNNRVNQQENRIQGLEQSSENFAADKATMSSNLSNLEQNISSTREQVKAVEFNLREKQYQINQLWNELDGAFAEVETAVTESNQRIKTIENFLYLDLNDAVNFDSGSDEINPEDEAHLSKLADMLKKNPGITLMIEGHTDTLAIEKKAEGYRDNWDLSVSRSTQVIRKLEELGVNPKQLIAAGRGEHMPDMDIDPKDLAAQRRTEFIIVPNVGKLYKLQKNKTKDTIKP